MDSKNDERHRTAGLMALWIGVLLPPVICAVEMETNFVLVRQACAAQRIAGLIVITVVALLITATTGAVCAVIWKRSGAIWPTDTADDVTRSRFIAVLGMMSSAISFVLILAHGIATIEFNPCQL